MDLKELLNAMREDQSAPEKVDEHIALFFNWKKGSDAKWRSPSNEIFESLPNFSSNLDDAVRLVQSTLPKDITFGCGWDSDSASACFAGKNAFEASQPAKALCFAAISYKVNASSG